MKMPKIEEICKAKTTVSDSEMEEIRNCFSQTEAFGFWENSEEEIYELPPNLVGE
jgi:hypothetical protein